MSRVAPFPVAARANKKTFPGVCRMDMQKGIIVSMMPTAFSADSPSGGALVYSPESGLSTIPRQKYHDGPLIAGHYFDYTGHTVGVRHPVRVTEKLVLGVAIEYDTVLSAEGNWIAINIHSTGDAYCVDAAKRVVVTISATVTNVCADGGCLVWSDSIGRIHAPMELCRPYKFKILDVVIIHARYSPDNIYEDVPWRADNMQPSMTQYPSRKLFVGENWQLAKIDAIPEMIAIRNEKVVAYTTFDGAVDRIEDVNKELKGLRAAYVKQCAAGKIFYRVIALWKENE